MRAYERLLKYVKVHTTSDPNSGTHPSTLRQFDLAKILVEELKELGIIEKVVPEKTPACSENRLEICRIMRKMIRNFVYDNLERDPEELVKERYEQFRAF